MKKYYNRTYYIVSNLIIHSGNELIADQLFDFNIYKPRLIKIISPNIKNMKVVVDLKDIRQAMLRKELNEVLH